MAINNRRIKVAVIGAGNMGKNHIRTYNSINEVELLAISDIDPETKNLASEFDINFYTNYIEMLDIEKPDAVSIVVPTPLHFEFAKNVISRGIHLMLEKPIASTVEESDELISAAKEANIIFSIGHVEHYNPMIQKLKKLVDDKEVGEISSIVIKRVGGFPGVEPKTNVIVDLAVHDIEIINYLLGQKPLEISSHGSKTIHSTEVDSAEILMKYKGASGFIQANWITPVKIRTIAVTGSEGYIEGNYISQEITYYKHAIKPINDSFKNFVNALADNDRYTISSTLKEPLKIELYTFIQAIYENDTSDDNGLVKATDARDALKIALEALQ
ncbi:MAG: Gfo/Idh/MocA family oxidoreductase [Acidimicrobiia bacterium]